MEPLDIAMYDRFAVRVPDDIETYTQGHALNTLRGVPAKYVIGRLWVDDNGAIRVRKFRPGEPEYDSPEIPDSAKEK